MDMGWKELDKGFRSRFVNKVGRILVQKFKIGTKLNIESEKKVFTFIKTRLIMNNLSS